MRWEHFDHQADIGIRGIGATAEEAFEQAALALVAAMVEPAEVPQKTKVEFRCEAPQLDLLLVEWLNAVIYEMASRRMVFGRFRVRIDPAGRLRGEGWGDNMTAVAHAPAVEVKGASYAELKVGRRDDGEWIAQCVVDV